MRKFESDTSQKLLQKSKPSPTWSTIKTDHYSIKTVRIESYYPRKKQKKKLGYLSRPWLPWPGELVTGLNTSFVVIWTQPRGCFQWTLDDPTREKRPCRSVNWSLGKAFWMASFVPSLRATAVVTWWTILLNDQSLTAIVKLMKSIIKKNYSWNKNRPYFENLSYWIAMLNDVNLLHPSWFYEDVRYVPLKAKCHHFSPGWDIIRHRVDPDITWILIQFFEKKLKDDRSALALGNGD